MPSGIIGYGAYIPMYRIRASEIAKMWGKSPEAVPIKEKAVAGPDEDVATIAVEASLNALARAGIDPSEIGAVHVGTESKPYAVKSTGITVAEAIGASRMITCADYELACKAGTEALQTCLSHVESGFAKYGLAIGVDTAQGRPGDELEYTAASGGAAFILGLDNLLAVCEGRCSWSSDTPDFWRREGQKYPVHAGRFTGEPAYFKHIINAAKALMEKLNFKPEDFTYAVFHQPNTKFPIKVAQILGFNMKQIEPGLLSPIIGNCYAGSSLLGLAAVLDVAKPDDRILVVSYGSGSGSDAFSFKVTELIEEKRDKAPLVKHYIERKVYIDYATYAKFRGKINLG